MSRFGAHVHVALQCVTMHAAEKCDVAQVFCVSAVHVAGLTDMDACLCSGEL